MTHIVNIERELPSTLREIMNKGIEFLQTNHYFTPEQYRMETGKEWSDDAAVYIGCGSGGWLTMSYDAAKDFVARLIIPGLEWIIICAWYNDGPPIRGTGLKRGNYPPKTEYDGDIIGGNHL